MTSAPPRRGKRNGGSSKADDAAKLIRENMKCPVCLEVLLPPIYQCETGHNICYLCVDEVTECPLCKSDYGDTRNYFAEELVNSTTFPCKYEEYGCHKTFLGCHLKEHQENCECQPYRCPELACQEVVGIHQMAQHLDKHGFKVMKGEVHQASLEILDDHFDRKTEYNPWRISTFGAEFYLISTRNRDGNWYFWAYGLGLQKDLRKFSYEILLFCDEKELLYRGVIQSLRTAPEDIMKSAACLVTTDSVIKSMRKIGKINCQVYFIKGKNWDAARPSVNASLSNRKLKHVTKNLKNTVSKGKKKVLIPNTAIYTAPKNTPGASKVSQSVHPIVSRTRALHLALKSSLLDKDNNNTKEDDSTTVSSRSTAAGTTTKTGKMNKKKSPASKQITDDENTFVFKIRETLRCSGCREVITPPVYQCVIGHNVCNKCKLSREDCALCRAPLGDTRNFFAEELLYKTFQRCVYSCHGCKVCLPSAHMRSHEAICDFAPFECPFNVCRTMVSAEDMFQHLQTHQIAQIDKELKGEIPVPRSAPSVPVCSIPNILILDKIPFYPIIVRNTDGSWLFYVITHNHSKYRYELLIKKQAKTLGFHSPVLSLRSSHSVVKQRGQGLHVTDKSLKSFKSSDKVSYQIKVFLNDDKNSSSGPGSTSWIMESQRGHVSKTELFANKKTSVSRDEESDDEDATTVVSGIGDEVVQNIETDGTETEDISDEDHDINTSYVSETSIDTATVVDELFESLSEESSQNYQVNQDHTSDTVRSVSEQMKRKKSPVEIRIITANHEAGYHHSGSELDMNNNTDRGRRSGSMTPLQVGGSSGLNSKASKVEVLIAPDEGTMPLSILRKTSSGSIGNLKVVKEGNVPMGHHSSSMLVNPTTDRSYKRRVRSASKNRVRMSDEVICCCDSQNPLKDPFGKHSRPTSKSQGNLRSPHESLSSLVTSGSKHVLSFEVYSDVIRDEMSSTPSEQLDACGGANRGPTTTVSKLPQPEGPDPMNKTLLREVELITAKSISEVSDAFSAVNDVVIGGSFNVVKSVLNLFTSSSPPADTLEDNSNENSVLQE